MGIKIVLIICAMIDFTAYDDWNFVYDELFSSDVNIPRTTKDITDITGNDPVEYHDW